MGNEAERSQLPIVVMKFGGTSVQDAAAISRTIEIISGRRNRKHHPVVVVSAMARVTDRLLAAAQAAVENDLPKALLISNVLRNRHVETAAVLVGRKLALLIQTLDELFDQLDNVLTGIAAVGELTPRTSDLVVSFGERLSSLIVAQALEHRGISSVHVDARTCIRTDAHFGKAAPLTDETDTATREQLLSIVEANAIPILGGFIASTRDNITTTLGRGGSDYSAALIGGALNAHAIEIWTDVNGVMTTDPRICPNALRLRSISFEEASELAFFGAKVLHPATILPAVKKNIPVWVLNSHNPTNEGTVITATATASSSPLKSIAVKRHLVILHIVSRRLVVSHRFLRSVFEVLDRYDCAINMVATSEISLSLAVDAVEHLDAIRADLDSIATIQVETCKALVCLVGEHLREQPGIAARACIAIRQTNLQMISQGANGINMSFMVDEATVESAVRALHAEFFADADPVLFDTTTPEAAP
ncbi:MAG: lysine-sensitive aspartokinase 3, partial [Terriglobus sp.]